MHLLPLGLASWLLFAWVAILVPGLALQRLARVHLDPALVLPPGTAWCAGTYWLSLATDRGWLFAVAQLVAAGALLLPLGPWRRADSPPLRRAVPFLLALVALLAVTQYRWNRLDASFDFLLDPQKMDLPDMQSAFLWVPRKTGKSTYLRQRFQNSLVYDFLKNELVVEFARRWDAHVILKGLRAISDFEYEFAMAQLNRKLAPEIETVFMMASPEPSFLSSSGVRESAAFGGSVDDLVPPAVARRLAEVFPRAGRPTWAGAARRDAVSAHIRPPKEGR